MAIATVHLDMTSPVLAAQTYDNRPSPIDDKSTAVADRSSDSPVPREVDALTALPSIPTPQDDRLQLFSRRPGGAPIPGPTEKESRAYNSTLLEPMTTLKHSGVESRPVMPGEAEILGAVRTMAQDRVYRTPPTAGPSTRQPEEQQRLFSHESEHAADTSTAAKSHVPTSRYNRTPSVTRRERTNTLHRSVSNRALLPRTSAVVPGETGHPSTPVDSSLASGEGAVRGSAAGPIPSDKRTCVLHTHPSNASMVSRARSAVDDADGEDTPLVSRLRSRPSSVRSHTQSFRSSQQLSPAPTTPLPDLPPLAMKRPSTRDRDQRTSVPNPLLASQSIPASPPLPSDHVNHAEMADFMLTQRMTVFRRFDEVHVRLLLQLQDEISTLERNLLSCERREYERVDKSSERSQVMRELRKKVAEYGEPVSSSDTDE